MDENKRENCIKYYKFKIQNKVTRSELNKTSICRSVGLQYLRH